MHRIYNFGFSKCLILVVYAGNFLKELYVNVTQHLKTFLFNGTKKIIYFATLLSDILASAFNLSNELSFKT